MVFIYKNIIVFVELYFPNDAKPLGPNEAARGPKPLYNWVTMAITYTGTLLYCKSVEPMVIQRTH